VRHEKNVTTRYIRTHDLQKKSDEIPLFYIIKHIRPMGISR
jgi:hypothetical protein